MPSHSDQYHPQDAIGNAFKGGGYLGVLGLVGAAVKNSLAPQNIGAWGVFTKSGNIILTSGTALSRIIESRVGML